MLSSLLLSSRTYSLISRTSILRPLLARMSSSAKLHHPNPIPATFLRGGTSKGIFLKRSDLPASKNDWQAIFLGIMGSPDLLYGRQLNGMGGGISSLSKVCVVEPATPEQRSSHNIDVQYTFVQIGTRDSTTDYEGNCGNLTSMIGVFALDEKMCPVNRTEAGRTRVRCFNTNTQKVIDTTFPISDEGIPILDIPETSIAGVSGQASQIVCEYINPSGARTGKLLPTSNVIDNLAVVNQSGQRTAISASLVDATNPSVFVRYDDLRALGLDVDGYIAGDETALLPATQTLEHLRKTGAQLMKLDTAAQAQPKIAFLKTPSADSDLRDNVDIVVHALSMGVLHKAIPLTVGLCLGVAAKKEGTLAWKIVQDARRISGSTSDFLRIRHPGGMVDIGAEIDGDGKIKNAKTTRTGRRLMKGVVWW